MTISRHPKLRFAARISGLSLRDSIRITFFMRYSHEELAPAIMSSLECYLNAVGRGALAWYGDQDADWRALDESGWDVTWRQLLATDWSGSRRIELRERADGASAYQFDYCGRQLEPFEPGAVCAVSFWLPTEYLEEKGASSVHQLALNLAAPVPFCSGSVGFAFNHSGRVPALAQLRMRYPGMDDGSLSWISCNIGTRIRGPFWMNFLGEPVLSELGGPIALRSRLASPGSTVLELDDGRAVVTLGDWPDAGDLDQGRTLPAYRELARILEPWLYQEPRVRDHLAAEETLRWERRFLD